MVFSGRFSPDTECVDLALHQIAKLFIDAFVTLNQWQSVKGLTDNQQIVVTTAGIAGMASVTGTVIFNFDKDRGERLQGLFYRIDSIHGRTFLKGLTVTLA